MGDREDDPSVDMLGEGELSSVEVSRLMEATVGVAAFSNVLSCHTLEPLAGQLTSAGRAGATGVTGAEVWGVADTDSAMFARRDSW